MLKTEQKSEFIQAFKNLQQINNIEFGEEESIHRLLTQVAETLVNQSVDHDSTFECRKYKNYLLKTQIQQDKIKARELTILHTGFNR